MGKFRQYLTELHARDMIMAGYYSLTFFYLLIYLFYFILFYFFFFFFFFFFDNKTIISWLFGVQSKPLANSLTILQTAINTYIL